jgi:hypothetical protein
MDCFPGMLQLHSKTIPYLSRQATICLGTVLSEADLSEDYEVLGGIEYRALNALLWTAPVVGMIICFTSVSN